MIKVHHAPAPGVDEAMIERLVHAFYRQVRADPVLGPIFAARISDWDGHLAKLCDFWSGIVLKSGRYHGNPMQTHLGLAVEASHFSRWLDLFATTAEQECPPDIAALFVDRARRIARSLAMGLDWHRNHPPTPVAFPPTPARQGA